MSIRPLDALAFVGLGAVFVAIKLPDIIDYGVDSYRNAEARSTLVHLFNAGACHQQFAAQASLHKIPVTQSETITAENGQCRATLANGKTLTWTPHQ